MKNTPSARKPIVDKLLLEERQAGWVAQHPEWEAMARKRLDPIVRMTLLGERQIDAGKKVRFR